jgi:dephospho-CoA kinase
MIPKPPARAITGYKLVGICGKAGSGKDTVADYLIHNRDIFDLWIKRVALAASVKKVVDEVFGVPVSMFNNREQKEELLEGLACVW